MILSSPCLSLQARVYVVAFRPSDKASQMAAVILNGNSDKGLMPYMVITV